MRLHRLTVQLLLANPLLVGQARADVFNLGPGKTNLQFVNVGNAGNSADPATGLGGVGSAYRIGTHEITNAQYADFLNKVGGSDPYSLYNLTMNTTQGGITRAGSSGSFTYSTIAGRENMPVAWVTWYDSVRFVNWLHNGQPAGPQNNNTTERGIYTLTGATAISGGRAANADYFLPTENEWYKAAYHQPASLGGDADSYWKYPTRSNTLASNSSPNGANYWDGNFVSWPGVPYTVAGSYSAGASFYGTFDQGGNVQEWNETLLVGLNNEQFRGLRGGSWYLDESDLQATTQHSNDPNYELYDSGMEFRIGAAPVPAPASTVLLGLGVAALAGRRRR